MNYSELVTLIQDNCQSSETSFVSHINEFIQTAENQIYMAVKGPIFWKVTDVGVLAAYQDVEYTIPGGVIDILSVRINTWFLSGMNALNSNNVFLLRKDYSFLREAYPFNSISRANTPKYYAVTGVGLSSGEPTMKFRVAPTPDFAFQYDIEYYGKSTTDSITSGNVPDTPSTTKTWLSVAFQEVLMYGAIYHAYVYQKGSSDMMLKYKSLFDQGLLMLANLSQERQSGDTYSKVTEESKP